MEKKLLNKERNCYSEVFRILKYLSAGRVTTGLYCNRSIYYSSKITTLLTFLAVIFLFLYSYL
jgi:hypothetical protein